jgi:tetratricopeptide (TPR) repeat protein
MKRFTSPAAAALCLAALFAQTASAKDAWTSVRSKNFLLVGNAPEKEIRLVATRLEQFRYVFSQLFPRANMASITPTTVVVFKSDSSYTPFKPLYNGKPQAVAGYFQPGTDVNYITLTPERQEERPFAVIFHEYSHQIINNNLSDPPLWFNEGLAEYYSTFKVADGDREITLGAPVSSHVYLLRGQFTPLETLLRVNERSPAYHERDKTGVFYAESWALVHYLLQSNKGQRVQQLGRFSALLGAGRPLEESFREAFQTDFKAMEKELRDYVQHDSYRVNIVRSEKPLVFDSEMTAAPLSEAEAEAYLGDLLMHTNRLDEAEARLRRSLALAPDTALAHASLGMLKVRQEKFGEAKEELSKAAAGSSQNYLAHYYYAYALTREGTSAVGGAYIDDPTAKTIRAEAKKAIELNPSFVEPYRLIGYVAVVTGQELDEAGRTLAQALRLAPSRHDLGLLLGEIRMRRQDWAGARAALEPVARSASAPAGERDQARASLQQIQSIEEEVARRGKENVAATYGGGGAADEGGVAAGRDAGGQAAAVRPTIKRRTNGEEVRATLTRVECGAGQSAVFVVTAGGRVLRLHAVSLDRVEFVSYVPALAGSQFGCGPRKLEALVFVTFRRAADPRSKIDGELLAVDFVTPDIELEPEEKP